jgi:tRNA(fMet)-specific endonuclease VapC
MRFLLDANTISDLVRHTHGRAAQRLQRAGEAQVCTSIIVAAELRYGASKKGSPALTARVDAALDVLDIQPFEAPADEIYRALRAGLEKTGRPISGNDMLIAAHALALGLTLVTDNEREFSRVDGLTCENWLR